ncbi:MAG: TusE/DsrC/DsvC family sulfur relay protein [Schleiferiaceae bacterium]|jgi:tRNA 2-thiouridine synthesizing protein E
METLTNIQFNPEGYLTDLEQWNPEVARVLAQEEGIELTEDHWKVLDYLQDQYKKEIPLTIRRVGKSGVVTIKEFYQLFPKGPLKISSRLAGIPKPASCI